MKIVVVSDSHGDSFSLKKVASIEKDADIYLHAGDSMASKEEIYPFISVQGNCDWLSAFDDRFAFATPYGKLIIQHRPFSYSYIEELEKQGYRIFINGHTHHREAEKISDLSYHFNPGSIALPRDGKAPSYLVLNISGDKVIYQFKEI